MSWYRSLVCGHFRKHKGFDQEVTSHRTPRKDDQQAPVFKDIPTQSPLSPAYHSHVYSPHNHNISRSSRLSRSKTRAHLKSPFQVNSSSSELDRTSLSSDYSYYSESDSDTESVDSCELSSSNYTDNSDISFNESSDLTCELSTHNYTPNTVFSPNESTSDLYEIFTQSTPLQLDNSDAGYINSVKEKEVFLNNSESSETETQEMGNSSNKVEPTLDSTARTAIRKNRNTRNKSFRNRSIRKNVSLVAFSVTPVCLSAPDSTTVLAQTFSSSYEHKPVHNKSLPSLLQESASLLPNLRSQDVPSSTESSSSSSSLDQEHASESAYAASCQDLLSSVSSQGEYSLDSDLSIEDIYTNSLPEQSQLSVASALSSLHRSLDDISKSLDTYENNMDELSKLQDFSETFSSLDSSLSSVINDELEDLDSSFSTISSFDSSDSFVYQPLNTSPTVHHQVKFNPSKSLEFLSKEKLLPDMDDGAIPLPPESEPTTLQDQATPSKRHGLWDSGSFSPSVNKSTSESNKCSPIDARDCEEFPTASTPVSKLLSGAAAALSTYNPRPLFREFSSSDSSLESGCESQDSGYSTNKLSLSSNTQSSASSSTDKVALVGKFQMNLRKSSPGSSSECLSGRSSSCEEISSFLGSYENCSSTDTINYPQYIFSSKPRVTSLMCSPEKEIGSTPPSLPERPVSPLRPVVTSSNTSMSCSYPVSSADSSTHPLYNSIHYLDISPVKRRKSNLFSKKLKSLKNLVKRRRNSCEVKRIGKEQLYAVPYETNSRENSPQKRRPTAVRVLQLL